MRSPVTSPPVMVSRVFSPAVVVPPLMARPPATTLPLILPPAMVTLVLSTVAVEPSPLARPPPTTAAEDVPALPATAP